MWIFFQLKRLKGTRTLNFNFLFVQWNKKKVWLRKNNWIYRIETTRILKWKKKLCKFYVDFVQWLQWKINFVFLRRKKILNWWVAFTHFLLVKKCIYWVWYSWNWLFSHSFEINLFFIQPFHFVCLSRRSDISIYLR